MTVTVTYLKETKNYVNYESPDMDFSHEGIKLKLWIPKREIQTNIPGVYPPEITLTIGDDSGKAEEEPQLPLTPGNDGPWL
jgi:hypothetical protein